MPYVETSTLRVVSIFKLSGTSLLLYLLNVFGQTGLSKQSNHSYTSINTLHIELNLPAQAHNKLYQWQWNSIFKLSWSSLSPYLLYVFGQTGLSKQCSIMKTFLYNFDPLKPHFYIVKLGFTGVYIFLLISPQKHRLWVLGEAVLKSTHNLCFQQKYEKDQNFFLKTFSFWW